MYEGNRELPHLMVSKPEPAPCPSPVYCDTECTRGSEENSREVPCCYDADTSNSSIDFNSSHDDVSQDSHHRGFGEAAARGAKSNAFYPISEETVFLDSPPTLPSITTSSPMSVDSWMMYSNSSSDEYSLSSHLNGGNSSNEETSDFELSSPHHSSTKRNYTLQFEDLELEDDEDEELIPPHVSSHKSVNKRLRVKEAHHHHHHHHPRSGGASRRSRSPAPMDVDVRMIDFAHTSFVTKATDSSSSTSTPATVHQGPDGGFLTGLDSLKRLLSQILAEG